MITKYINYLSICTFYVGKVIVLWLSSCDNFKISKTTYKPWKSWNSRVSQQANYTLYHHKKYTNY